MNRMNKLVLRVLKKSRKLQSVTIKVLISYITYKNFFVNNTCSTRVVTTLVTQV